MNNKFLKTVVIVVGVAVLGAMISWLIYLGVHTEEVMIKVGKVYTVYTVKATAEYSETKSGIDFDGDYYSETDTWSEQASDKIRWVTEDGVPSNVKIPDPQLYRNIDRGYDFDGINWYRSLNYYLIAELRGEETKFTLNELEYKRVLNRSDDVLRVEINVFDIIRKIK